MLSDYSLAPTPDFTWTATLHNNLREFVDQNLNVSAKMRQRNQNAKPSDGQQSQEHETLKTTNISLPPSLLQVEINLPDLKDVWSQ